VDFQQTFINQTDSLQKFSLIKNSHVPGIFLSYVGRYPIEVIDGISFSYVGRYPIEVIDGIFLSYVGRYWRWEKHKKGGVELCSQKLFVPYVEELFSGSESEVIQSLSEFRVVCSG